MSQVGVLKFLSENEGFWSASEICERVGITKSSIHKSLRKLRASSEVKHRVEWRRVFFQRRSVLVYEGLKW